MPVASVCLHRGQFTAAGYSSPVVCPDGNTIIVKSVSFAQESATSSDMWLGTSISEGIVFSHVLRTGLLDGASWEQQVWIVLNPGDQVWVHSSAVGATFWISGSLLAGEAAWTPPVMATMARADLLPAF